MIMKNFSLLALVMVLLAINFSEVKEIYLLEDKITSGDILKTC